MTHFTQDRTLMKRPIHIHSLSFAGYSAQPMSAKWGRHLPGRVLALGMLTGLAWGAAHAQEVPETEEMVVISSRIPVPMRQISTSVSVITEHQIEAHGNLALSDILRQQTSISTSSNGGAGGLTSLRIRGEEGFRTMTIFDGLRLQDSSGPQVGPRLEHLLSAGVSRVEVLRGPQGLSYGADAGGVVNLTSTRYDHQEGWQGRLDAQLGRYGTEQYSAFVS